MKGELPDGAPYRVVRCTDADDPRIHGLSHAAFRARMVLRLTLPATGLGVVYLGALSEQCGMTKDELTAALQELERAGFVRRTGLHVLLVGAFGDEPNLNAGDLKHRKFVRRLLASAGDCPLVGEFRIANERWFPEADAAASPIADLTRGPDWSETLERVSGDPPEPAAVAEPTAATATATATAVKPASASDARGLAGQGVDGSNGNDRAAPQGGARSSLFMAHLLTECANRCIAERWGARASPIAADAKATLRAVKELEAAGIPHRFSADTILQWRKADHDTPSGPPRSLRYFIPAIRERWAAVKGAGA